MKPVFLLSLLLAGCQTAPISLPPSVEVPVSVPCRAVMPATPAWATDTMQPGADIYERTVLLLAEREQRIGFETQLIAAVGACQ